MRPVILDVIGYELNAQEKEVLAHPLVAGVILFTRNFYNIVQLKELVAQIRLYAQKDIVIAVDHEGGRVQRFRDDFTILPAAGDLLLHSSLEEAKILAYASAWIMASELIACDIDFSFAPVVDINGISDVIGTRAFAQTPEHVTALTTAYIKGMQAMGMVSTGKHFPGHGNVKADSHVALPVDSRSLVDIMATDIAPFKSLIDKDLLTAVMPSHVVYEQCDEQPAGFSAYWLQKVLRQQLGFSGVIISDDLSMHGASFVGNHVTRARSALDAGCDLILACNDSDAAISILDALIIPKIQNDDAIIKMRHQGNKCSMPLNKNPIWIENHQKLMHFADRI
ncbi:beta-N-acetylhexosaminidase [Psychromonas sp. Urea-02u-13]|uniref:beta-N-acetylhexosaminidase n=1 Tax=Psychromonas sp. Urea-02u-13 TaxID=2058326 RepID=UPI000C33C133|nr:beta-N-acetylhexosaminidase [Psychromonas sp. Urea-02u-13]PKG39587.1 beta-N-acetylhexosaminidase [Psychromonas sp. Urea-02u-13]